MTPRAIAIVKQSFTHVLPIRERTAARFYARLFQMAPETRAMFTTDMEEQGRKLVDTIAAVVDNLDTLDRIVPAVRALAVRHVDYGVRDEHYGLVGLALIETLRELLGREAFEGELEAAWRDAYKIVATTMIAAAADEAPRPA